MSWILLGGAALAAAGFVAIRLLLLWSLRTQIYEPADRAFADAAVRNIERFAGGALPPGVRVNRYVRMPNFNDGSELWDMTISDPEQLGEMLARLRLKPVAPEHPFPWLDTASRMPAWVERPGRDMKQRYALDEADCPARRCNPIHYLWSSDGERFFLYRITF